MRVPLAPAGLREMVILTIVFGGAAASSFFIAATVHGYGWTSALGILFLLLWLGGIAFFRDPERMSPTERDVMLAPADGKVTEISMLDEHPDIGGPATRIGIFLSIFSVHVNRSPCSGTVKAVRYQPGRFVDARRPDSGIINESNTIVIEPDNPQDGPVVVRQIVGAVARRIVCSLRVGDRVTAGERIGLIKFGSRTELILPGHDRYTPSVRIGDGAVGAMTILARKAIPTGGSARTACGSNGIVVPESEPRIRTSQIMQPEPLTTASGEARDPVAGRERG
jgi:phosphatidylserine decarboxylase